jgi:SRSO17 transposase
MLEGAFRADIPAKWVVADSFYGRSHAFRHWLEKRGRSYALMVPKTDAVRYPKGAERGSTGWPSTCPRKPGRRGCDRRTPQWEAPLGVGVCLVLYQDARRGRRRRLLGPRSRDDPDDRAFYQAYGPKGTPVEELVRVCRARWAVQEGFAEAKGEVGLDHYEVRKWEASGTATSPWASWPTPTRSPRACPPAVSRRGQG